MDVYRHLSTFDIKWDTNLIAIPEASHGQIQDLIRRKSDYPKVQQALRSMELGNGPYLEITIEDHQSDKYAHVILAYGRTKTGLRRVAICEFRQCSSLSAGGLLGTMVVYGVVGHINPAAGILTFIAKVAADYAISKQDVSVVVAIKELVRAGFLRVDETTMQIQLG
ncbi:unnamed protein product [Rotaria sordida]|uniref:Uncharacterized protein n=1 Tax=Rotaria sordida TaxID=392033 RepID=A0A819E7P2_9BILA|nr:unnamed protein product [Rotaria sordida]CAF3846798.1 unnamed protein product [Rotaria sordida]